MKIIHICQYYNDGYGYQENLLPKYQKKIGHDVKVITSDRGSYFAGGENPKIVGTGHLEDSGIPIERLPIWGEFKGRFVWYRGLNETLEKEKPDYIFHHGICAPSLITCAKYKKKNPKVFLVADNHADLNNSGKYVFGRRGYYKALWSSVLKTIVNSIDLFFGVSPVRCYFPQDYLAIPSEKIRLLPIGADTDAADMVVSSPCFAPENNNGSLKLVTGGKWTKNKRLEIILKAIEGLNVHLNIFGRIEYPEIQQMIDKQDNVSSLGWQDRENTLSLLADADVAVWPSLHTTLMEDAIATTTPLILRYQGNTSHHIRGNGAYFFSNNPMEIRQLLEMMIKNPEFLKKMKQHTQAQRDLLSYDRVAKDSIDYYYDQAPQTIHRAFMEDPFCNPENPDFERINP